MLSFSGSLKVFVAVAPCDLRQGFNGLHTAVAQRLGEDPKSGALFVFTNRRHTRLKILYWDGTGLWLLTNRLATHCPFEPLNPAALSVSPVVSRGIKHFGSRWRALRHAGGTPARWDPAWHPLVDV